MIDVKVEFRAFESAVRGYVVNDKRDMIWKIIYNKNWNVRNLAKVIGRKARGKETTRKTET
jgi:hypothetical protein